MVSCWMIGAGDFPFINWYDFDQFATTGNFNDMREDDEFSIIFEDVHVQFDSTDRAAILASV